MPVWARVALVGLLLTPLVPGSASAQFRRNTSFIHGPISIGPRVGRDFENHAWSLGGQIGIPVGKRLEVRPSGDLFFPKHGDTGWQLNGDAAIHFGQGGGLPMVVRVEHHVGAARAARRERQAFDFFAHGAAALVE